MELPKTKSFIANDILFVVLVCGLILFVNSNSVKFEDENNPHEFDNNTSSKTGNSHPSAMDLILAINRNTPVKRTLHKKNAIDGEMAKRMNITKFSNGTMVITNTTEVLNGTDMMLQENIEEKVADHLLEGDILLDPMDPEDYKIAKLIKEDEKQLAENSLQKRQATRALKHLWTSRVVPYEIDWSLSDYKTSKLIKDTIARFNTKSCVKFMPRQKTERDWVVFIKNDGCSSSIGRSYVRPGFQQISIDEACKHPSIILHEMLHCVGFYHEQSRPDRDNFLKIMWENISPELETQFEKYSHGQIDQFGLNYNYQSLMQYGRKAFSSNNQDTMQSITDPNMYLGGDYMTNQDITELNTLYDCRTTRFNSWTSWSPFSPCNKQCYKSRQRYCYGRDPQACGGSPNAYGIETNEVKCSKDVCPAKIDGHWGNWGLYGPCTEQCNEGVRERERQCDKPVPENGGKNCPGFPQDLILCVYPRCSLGPYDTDFRDNHLGKLWKNDIYDTPQFDWKTHKGTTYTEGTGPSIDHLRDYDGYYLYVESSGRAKDDKARMFTEYLPKTNGTCFSFYYHMYGRTTGTLILSLFPQGGSILRQLFTKSGSQGSLWHFQRVDIKSPSRQYQLVFEARVANGDYSDIALDDLFFDDGSCDCQNSYRNCDRWAERKDCVASYDFMMKNCKKACDFCTCVDKRSDCEKWVKTECGRNSKYYNWMDVMCPVTCRRCVCHDENVKCAEWKNNNQCEDNPVYMNKHCRRSCGLCTIPERLG